MLDEFELEIEEELADLFGGSDYGSDVDNRPPPKPRKHMHLWQSYQLWDELMKMRQRHNLRISSAERGKSQMDAGLERTFLEELDLDNNLKYARKMMISYGKQCGPVWQWLTSIRGLAAGGEAAKLLAQIDDISKFDTVAKLWRFCGYAVIDGAAEKNKPGEKSHYNRKLKSICYMVGEQFIRQQTPYYVDIYYAEKARQRQLYPEVVKVSATKKIYTDAHLHNRAWRKMVKEFLKDLWLEWREAEGLPLTDEWSG